MQAIGLLVCGTQILTSTLNYTGEDTTQVVNLTVSYIIINYNYGNNLILPLHAI